MFCIKQSTHTCVKSSINHQAKVITGLQSPKSLPLTSHQICVSSFTSNLATIMCTWSKLIGWLDIIFQVLQNLRAVILFACAQWDLNTTSCTEGEESLDFSTKYPMKVWEILSWRKFQQVIILGFLEKVITLWAFYPYWPQRRLSLILTSEKVITLIDVRKGYSQSYHGSKQQSVANIDHRILHAQLCKSAKLLFFANFAYLSKSALSTWMARGFWT